MSAFLESLSNRELIFAAFVGFFSFLSVAGWVVTGGKGVGE